MRFNSYVFLFAFLPVTLVGYQLAAHWHRRAVVVWLSLVSLLFYAYWRPPYVLLLCASILFNYTLGAMISRRIPNRVSTQALLLFAIAVNLLALCYYKYLFPLLNFFTAHSAQHSVRENILLPLGISFFTFTQIAYLIDLQQGEAVQQDLASYTLFATFFPHLIAGPILHHAEIMPQFQEERDYRLRWDDVTVGFSWFIMGLAKKVLLADHFALAADPAFFRTKDIGAAGAWAGVLSYALQLYFDFSGYSDMALGLARMFSINFPLNFNSPYKAGSIIDFWQRWHMTLTRYINAYLYNPLSLYVSRRRAAQGKKISRKAMATPGGFAGMIAAPTVLSLFLAGVWHGAGYQFFVFGMLHALYLTANHAWRIFRGSKPVAFFAKPLVRPAAYAGRVLLTLAAVVLAQIFFRAFGVRSATQLLSAMAGLHRIPSPNPYVFRPTGFTFAWIVAGFLIVWLLPNTQQILALYKPSLDPPKVDGREHPLRTLWKPTLAWGTVFALLFFAALVQMEDPTTFLYFQF